ncbi:MAG: hypothetical protein HY776_07245 [Actinobacteria bacterium]|nr:hypothetical protein [Actinomycetota bacterium]
MFFKNKLNVLAIIILLVLILGGCRYIGNAKDIAGYGVIVVGENTKNIILKVPVPMRNGKVMNELTENFEIMKDKSTTMGEVKTKVVDTKYGPMLEIRISELNGAMWIKSRVVKKNYVYVADRDPVMIDFWLNPRIINGKKFKLKKGEEANININKEGKKETLVSSYYEGNSLKISVGLDVDAVGFIGWMDYSWTTDLSEKGEYTKVSVTNENEYQKLPFKESAVSDLGGI